MLKLVLYSILHSALFTVGLILLKFALNSIGDFRWEKSFFVGAVTNYWLLLCGIAYFFGNVIWFYVMKNFPLSTAYPLSSLSYVFGTIGAIIFFQEEITVSKLVGIVLITVGCYFVVK